MVWFRPGRAWHDAFLPACRCGLELSRPAECNKAPFMYEMKGALSGHATPDRPVARPPRRRAPPRQGQAPAGNTGFPAFPAPGVAPGWCPFPTVKAFLRPPRKSRKSLREFNEGFFPVHTLPTEFRRLSARHGGYPPAYAQTAHRLPGVTRRIPAQGRRALACAALRAVFICPGMVRCGSAPTRRQLSGQSNSSYSSGR